MSTWISTLRRSVLCKQSFAMSSVCCAVKGCQRRRENSEGVYFHTLPPSAARKRVWEEAIGCSSLPYSARVCSAHFLDSDYLPQYGNRRLVNRLRWTAVPSVDLPACGDVVPTTSAADSGYSSDASTEASILKQPWRHCAVVGCTKPTQPMHRMPQKDELLCKWLKLIGLPKSETRTFLFVCQRHFAADAYTQNPDLQEDMGFTARYYLRSDAMPSLSLPSEPYIEEEEETLMNQTTAASERVAEAPPRAPLRQYGRRRPRGTVTTQTAHYQCTVGVQASTLAMGRYFGVQACSFGISMGTQTEVQPAATCTIQNAASLSDPMCNCGVDEPCHCSSLMDSKHDIHTNSQCGGRHQHMDDVISC
ncbi:uncharacterized protein LOC119404972 isoform X3 [Rhipicephalus sanguineus]|uniref:uncharacterized protein LOC119404972 isoform X3 n=1 Tax=Rhipicephalus sanguineus TaxID=34632 RepID=UPI0020C28091|nr:uncharacterized protein LOC119404972 isoform X3 [Rhipicephalus sanguineus]